MNVHKNCSGLGFHRSIHQRRALGFLYAGHPASFHTQGQEGARPEGAPEASGLSNSRSREAESRISLPCLLSNCPSQDKQRESGRAQAMASSDGKKPGQLLRLWLCPWRPPRSGEIRSVSVCPHSKGFLAPRCQRIRKEAYGTQIGFPLVQGRP